MRALLDVNALIALLDENHTHHAAASDWFGNQIELGWASCPLTQNGCVRIVSQPRYPNARSIADVVTRLQAGCRRHTLSSLHPWRCQPAGRFGCRPPPVGRSSAADGRVPAGARRRAQRATGHPRQIRIVGGGPMCRRTVPDRDLIMPQCLALASSRTASASCDSPVRGCTHEAQGDHLHPLRPRSTSGGGWAEGYWSLTDPHCVVLIQCISLSHVRLN